MTNDQQIIIATVARHVREKLDGEGSDHDWWHVYRVWEMAKRLCENEQADFFVVELAALLHDIADWKSHDGDETVGPRVAREVLANHNVDTTTIDQICGIISTISFKGAGVAATMQTLEGQIVQDADRLDAIGAIGIARAFTYGGSKGRALYDPSQPPTLHTNKESYFKNNSHTINHFYEKLLLLKDLMNTTTAKHIAEHRHQFMEVYLEEFLDEWNGTK